MRWETDFGAAALSHVNLYDRTVEGLELLDVPGGTVQYHPEAGPGPHDSLYLFDRFLRWRPHMPRRDDIQKILILGSGPIVIGQAAEFDYSGVQACKVLREEGYEVVLVNSNPATIMTDPEFADATYIEPLLPGPVAQVIERERPDALLPTLGGQTALNLAKALHEDGTLERFGVELIGANYEAIACAEDRELFGAAMARAGLRMPKSAIATTRRAGAEALGDLGLPCIVRPAFTLGGRGGGIARTERGVRRIVARGMEASPIGQVLLDQSVIGWGEFELEVMRDHADNVVIVCSIENVDPMGVHTGDSVTVAPQQTLTDRLYQRLRDQAIAVIRAVGVETGGSNVQFAVNPETEEILVIEMNPRVSRSSALASKATGFPIAKIAARLAVGYRLEEIDNDITGVTPACFEPTIDYVVVKWPRFAFEKFPGADPTLTTHMKSVGEAMAIGRTFGQAFAKALRSRELDKPPCLDASLRGGAAGGPEDARARALRGDPRAVRPGHGHRGDPRGDARSTGGSCASCRRSRSIPSAPFAGERSFRSVDTCAAEFPARTPYYYSGWERGEPAADEVRRGERESVVILGSGPNRIGQGIEFDYCCVHAAMTVRESGRDAVMVNCNPETVSTDYDTSDRLYFEPLTLEDVLAVVEVERPKGVIVQFGGQTPLKLAAGLAAAGVPLLGTSVDAIDLAEDRGRFGALLERWATGAAVRDRAVGRRRRLRRPSEVGFPLLVRPSYVLGGRAMEIVYSREGLADYLRREPAPDPTTPPASPRPEPAEHLPRPLPRERHRGRCRRAVRRRGGVDRRDHAARRGGRRALRRQRVRAAAALARRGDARADPRRHARDRARDRRRRADQRPVRGPRRRAVRDRGQPARLAHGAVRLEGGRRAAGEARLPDHARRADRGPGAARRQRGARLRRARLGQGGGAAVRPLRGLRRGARPGDALDRRGDGDRARLPDRVRQGAGRRRRAAAERGHGVHHGHRLRQGGRVRGRADPARQRLSRSSPRAAPPRRSRAWACRSSG